MTTEYFVKRTYSREELASLILGMEELRAAEDKDSLINSIINCTISEIGLWLTAPISVATAGVVAGYLFDAFDDMSNAMKNVLQNGINAMSLILAVMNSCDYDLAKINLCVIDINNEGNKLIVQGAEAMAFHKGTGWISQA